MGTVYLASVGNDVGPFVVFGVFMLIFSVRARRRGQSVNEFLNARNRETFTDLKPGWWRWPVAGAAVMWAVSWVASGLKPAALIVLPVVVLWIPMCTLGFRAYFRSR